MLVAEWMTRDPVTILASGTLGEVAATMVRRKVRRLPVVAAPDGPLIGIISKGDVLGGAPAHVNPFSPAADGDARLAVPLRPLMTPAPVTVAADVPLEVAAQLMIDRKIGGLPVMTGPRLVGILTESDLFRAFAAALGGGGAGLRITFELAASEDVVPMVVKLAAHHHQRVTSVATYVVAGRTLAVVRLVGPDSPALVDELWKTGHQVRSVLRLGTAAP
jgi:acetoin utilization protein AcuB